VIFGTIPLAEAEGTILAHAVRTPSKLFEKGRHLNAEDITALRAAGCESVVAARLEPGDIAEDEAASQIAAQLAGPGLKPRPAFTGRANLHAETDGLLRIDADCINQLNALDEGLTVATQPAYAALNASQMAATVKIIPFALPRHIVSQALDILKGGTPTLSLAPFRPKRFALITSVLPSLKSSVIAKTRQVTANRVAALRGTLVNDVECPHNTAEIARAIQAACRAGAEIVLVAGAAATSDRNDTVPAAIRDAGGEILHFGMPADPGNLLLLGRVGEAPVIGLPGCARSPKLNGVDWVLQRLAADIPVVSRDIMAMGVGGLLTEIPARPQPRAQTSRPGTAAPRIGAVLLAAGLARRMGHNKLLSLYQGETFVRRVARHLIEAGLTPVIVVTGHEAAKIEPALAGLPVRFVSNPDYENGLASSLVAGITALDGEGVDAGLVALADMPLVGPEQIRRIADAYNPAEGKLICVPVYDGKQGNPVLWGANLFPELKMLSGDRGAKPLFAAHHDEIMEVELGDPGILIDVDTPEALARLAEIKP
jgi:molybdenum cofactor cytidylyltransferase